MELVTNPSIIFVDEPTSGLDARVAAIVMSTIRNAIDTGRTVVCIIHQPSIAIFEDFDEVPPQGKGSLYIRPLLMGSGAVLGLAPAPEYTFLIYVSPVGNYFKEGLAPINLVVESEFHRASPGGTGGIKTMRNYASIS